MVSPVQSAVAALIFPALFCLLLTRDRPLWTLAVSLGVAQALWANMDASFLLGPVLCLLAALQSFQLKRRGESSEGPGVQQALPVAADALSVLLAGRPGHRSSSAPGGAYSG